MRPDFGAESEPPPADLVAGISEAAITTDPIALAAVLARHGRHRFFVAESDEGLGAFLVIEPVQGAPWLLRLGAGEATTALHRVPAGDPDAIAIALTNPAGWLWSHENAGEPEEGAS